MGDQVTPRRCFGWKIWSMISAPVVITEETAGPACPQAVLAGVFKQCLVWG
jgi:hypothetical protein